MEKTALTLKLVWFCLFFLIGTIPIYIFKREFYINNRVAFRKLFYGIILGCIVLLWYYDSFPFTTVPELTVFLVGIILMDLMIFQTPDITKFLANELKHEQVEETFDENRGGAYEDLLLKLNKMNEVIEDNDENFMTPITDFANPEDYVSFLNSYLESYFKYTSAKSYIYYIDSNSSLIEGIEDAYKKMDKNFSFTYGHLGMREKHFFRKLAEGSSVEIIGQTYSIISYTKRSHRRDNLAEFGDSYMIFVYSGEYHSLLFLLASDQEFGATGANTPIIQNLLRAADIWIQKQVLRDEFKGDEEFKEVSMDGGSE